MIRKFWKSLLGGMIICFALACIMVIVFITSMPLTASDFEKHGNTAGLLGIFSFLLILGVSLTLAAILVKQFIRDMATPSGIYSTLSECMNNIKDHNKKGDAIEKLIYLLDKQWPYAETGENFMNIINLLNLNSDELNALCFGLADKGELEKILLLIKEKKVNINITDKKGATLSHHLVISSPEKALVLKGLGADWTLKDINKRTPWDLMNTEFKKILSPEVQAEKIKKDKPEIPEDVLDEDDRFIMPAELLVGGCPEDFETNEDEEPKSETFPIQNETPNLNL